MATLNLANPFIDFTGQPARQWTVMSVTAERLTFHSGPWQLVMEGQFTVDAAGNLAGGTATAGVWNDGAYTEAPSFRISDLSLDALALARAVTEAAGDQDIFTFLLSGDDTVNGTSSVDYLEGAAGNDVLNAGAGNDRILEGDGSDTIDGGAGFDVVSYTGRLGDYVIERTATGYKVTNPVLSTDGSRPAEVDLLANVERLYFSDKHVALIDADSTAGQVFRMYQAAFGRAPDEPGLDFWTAQMDTKGVKLADIAFGFIASNELHKLYGDSTSNHDLVAKYYEHILHRAPDQSGLAFWTDVLDNHKASHAQVLAAISDSPESVALSVTLIGTGVVMDPPVITM